MTPQQVRVMSTSEYLAFVDFMNREIRDRERAARKAKKGRR